MIKQPRIYSIDSLKVVAIIGVICTHAHPFARVSLPVAEFIDQAVVFAVPFLFIVSGFLFIRKVHRTGEITRTYVSYMKRLGIFFAGWSLIYLFIPENLGLLNQAQDLGVWQGIQQIFRHRIDNIVSDPVQFLLMGTSTHLWYVVSLAISLTILFLFIKDGFENRFIYLAVPLYIFGFLAGPYANTPIGIHVGVNTVTGPFVSSIFVAVGAILARKDYRPTLVVALLVLLVGFSLHMGEGYTLHWLYGWSSYQLTGYFLSTVIYGTGFMLLALSRPDLGKSIHLPHLGRYTPGLYGSHMAVLPFMEKILLKAPAWVGEATLVGSVFAISLLISWLMAKVPHLKKLAI